MVKHYIRLGLIFSLRLVVATAVISAFFVLTQDFLIFPGLFSSQILGSVSVAPKDIEVLRVQSSDTHEVVVWKLRGSEKPRTVAILFHGNAEHLHRFVQVQRWLLSLGIASYSVEYRGYSGRGSGWPSEMGLYADSEAVFRLVEKEEQIAPKDVVVLGSSIGTGVAAYLAQKANVGTLVLLSPYTSLKNVAAETPLFGLLTPFMKYEFPSSEYIARLTDTCVIAAHGARDSTISHRHSADLQQRYRGSRSFNLILEEEAGHNNILKFARNRIEKQLSKCILERDLSM